MTELRVDIPHIPHLHDALESLPEELRSRWAKTYEAAFREAHAAHLAAIDDRNERSGPEPEGSPHAIALAAANKLLVVPDPKSLKEALAMPGWQLVKRTETDRIHLPGHLKRRVEAANKYLHVVTIDGKEHVFPIAA